jgi:hypothetical protein
VGSDDQPEEIHVDWQDLEKPLDCPSGKAYKIIVNREPIPIIILPGIMGTRLRQSRDKNLKIWDPDDSGFMLKSYGTVMTNALDKMNAILGPKRVYDPSYLKVDEADDKHNKKFDGKARYPNPAARGWGGVVWDAYQNVILGLENRTWPAMINVCFKLPVYAVGYDWRGSAKVAGQKLADRIRQIKSDNPGCKKVILITHSMGGLVARSACNAGLESDVMGSIYTVQPVTGAPAAYWRMKAGFERGRGDTAIAWAKSYPTAWVLGADGLEVTGLLGHMPGGLQLLPSMSYEDNSNHPGWLIYQPPGGGAAIRVPRSGDPYGEIYRDETSPWRLILWKQYLTGNRGASEDQCGSAWADFLKCLGDAEAFHRGLGVYQHPKSWHFYGQGRMTADSVTMTESTIDATIVVDNVNGVYYDPTPSTAESGSFSYAGPSRDENGATVASYYQMSDPDGDGDSTVPRSSGSILVGAGAPGVPLANSGHDSCFKDNDLVGSTDLATNIGRIIEDLCLDKINAEKRW